METFEELLRSMEAAYRAQSGHEAEDVSDTGLRLRVLAGELYRLWAKLQWLRREAFPQTATGDRLDLHGEQRGIIRKEAAHAVGTITFSRYLPMSFDLVIPQGTVCATSGEEPVEYETMEETVLTAGEVSVDAPARAVLGGRAGNCASGRITVLTAVPAGINYCVNREAFTGGADPEDDEAYRARILAAYAQPDNGTNAAYYKEIALAQPGVTSAQVVPRGGGDGTVNIYLWGEGTAPGEEMVEAVKAAFEKRRELGITVDVMAASARKVNVGILFKVPAGADYAAAEALVQQAIRDLFAKKQVGDPVYLTEYSRAALDAVPAIQMQFSSGVRDAPAADAVMPVIGNLVTGEIT